MSHLPSYPLSSPPPLSSLISHPLSFILHPLSLLILLLPISLLACQSNDKSPRESASQRADQALRDPFNYKPADDRYDISGGDIKHFDKDAFRKDVDNVLNP